MQRRERQRQRAGAGRTVSKRLVAEPADVDLGGQVVGTWTYGGRVPGAAIRATAGDQLAVDVVNTLAEPTTVHWHGLRLRNDMDGVPNLTQPQIPAGERMRYTFTVPDPGTYWLHPHVGLQRERGLYAPLIVDDPHEPGNYEVEFVVLLDDWTDGAGASPDDILQKLRAGGMGTKYRAPVTAGKIGTSPGSWQYHMPLNLADPPPGTPPASVPARLAGDVEYPFYLLNGRLPTAPETLRARPGQRARIRVINAGGQAVFRVALGGHRMTVTHTDGFPVEPVTVDTLQIASGERYDMQATLGDGAFPLVAVAEGKHAQALGVVRTASGPAPAADTQPAELAGRLLDLTDLRAPGQVRLNHRAPDARHTVYLTGSMQSYEWRINGLAYDAARPFASISPLAVRGGEHVRLALLNQTPMYHPMHLHGHTFQVRRVGAIGKQAGNQLLAGTRKDTLMVAPGQRIDVDITADNPGQWLTHCHNAFHLATGMATVLSYVAP